ncbi:MAG: HAD-IIIA family hydrolase [Lachnospiraceae bacterium]|nr:HAD-IIIA family hydrolase [Lachnospiraceae bacterium]
MGGLYPNDYIDSVYDVNFKKLYEEGYRLLLFDVDNTLVPHGAPADERAIQLFQELREIGFQTWFLSNNKEPRVKSFCEAVNGTSYIFKCGKPDTEAYLDAVKRSGCQKSQTFFFGDQIFTDMWGANKSGIRNCMVKPVLKWKEEPQIVLKRLLEAIILAFYSIHTSGNRHKNLVPLKSNRK